MRRTVWILFQPCFQYFFYCHFNEHPASKNAQIFAIFIILLGGNGLLQPYLSGCTFPDGSYHGRINGLFPGRFFCDTFTKSHLQKRESKVLTARYFSSEFIVTLFGARFTRAKTSVFLLGLQPKILSLLLCHTTTIKGFSSSMRMR